MDELREEREELDAIQREDEDDAREQLHDEWCWIACPHEPAVER